MPTKIQIKAMHDFFTFSKKYDNLRVRYYRISKSRKDDCRGYSYHISLKRIKDIQFKIKLQENNKYKIVTLKDSKISVPKNLSFKRFNTPEDALKELIPNLISMGFKPYSSNTLDFILGD